MSSDLRPTDELVALSAGNHIAEIVRVSHGATDNGPHIDLTVRSPDGELSDRVAYRTAKGARRVVALSHAAGIPMPSADELEADGTLPSQFVGSLTGKAVGVVVRDHADGVAVAGYVWPGMLPR